MNVSDEFKSLVEESSKMFDVLDTRLREGTGSILERVMGTDLAKGEMICRLLRDQVYFLINNSIFRITDIRSSEELMATKNQLETLCLGYEGVKEYQALKDLDGKYDLVQASDWVDFENAVSKYLDLKKAKESLSDETSVKQVFSGKHYLRVTDKEIRISYGSTPPKVEDFDEVQYGAIASINNSYKKGIVMSNNIDFIIKQLSKDNLNVTNYGLLKNYKLYKKLGKKTGNPYIIVMNRLCKDSVTDGSELEEEFNGQDIEVSVEVISGKRIGKGTYNDFGDKCDIYFDYDTFS